MKFKRVAAIVASTAVCVTLSGCASDNHRDYGGPVTAGYYDGPGYYDSSYPYYRDLNRNNRDGRDHRDGHDGEGHSDHASSASRAEPAAVPAGHAEHAEPSGGRGASTAGGHIGGGMGGGRH